MLSGRKWRTPPRGVASIRARDAMRSTMTCQKNSPQLATRCADISSHSVTPLLIFCRFRSTVVGAVLRNVADRGGIKTHQMIKAGFTLASYIHFFPSPEQGPSAERGSPFSRPHRFLANQVCTPIHLFTPHRHYLSNCRNNAESAQRLAHSRACGGATHTLLVP